METSKFKAAALAVAICVLTTGTAFATDGYFSTGYGTANKGMGGAGVALSQDTQSAMKNPAAMKNIGTRLDAAISFFSPDRSYETNGAAGTNFMNVNSDRSGSKLFLVPSMGVNWDRGDYSIGITLSANGGMNTDYNTNVFTGGTSGKTGIDLAQAFLGLTYARRLNENHTIGITPTLAIQRFKATGLQGFASISGDSTKLTDNGYDYSTGGGFRVGWQGKFGDKVTIGAMAQTKMYMEKFDKYAGLFARNGMFDIPATAAIGMAYKPIEKLTIAFDAQRIFYGGVDSIANPLISVAAFHTGAGGSTNENSLGNSQGVGFGWEDMNVLKLGISYDYNDKLTLRTGISHNSDSFSSGEVLFNILAPGVVNTHASVGASYDYNDKLSLNFAYTHAFHADIEGTNVNHIFGGTATPINLEMDQHDLEVGLTYRF